MEKEKLQKLEEANPQVRTIKGSLRHKDGADFELPCKPHPVQRKPSSCPDILVSKREER